jgi:hypothetical protein
VGGFILGGGRQSFSLVAHVVPHRFIFAGTRQDTPGRPTSMALPWTPLRRLNSCSRMGKW